jgi:hypothetical protein
MLQSFDAPTRLTDTLNGASSFNSCLSSGFHTVFQQNWSVLLEGGNYGRILYPCQELFLGNKEIKIPPPPPIIIIIIIIIVIIIEVVPVLN